MMTIRFLITLDPELMVLARAFTAGSNVNAQLNRIEKNMATRQDFETLRVALNEATNKIAARIQALVDRQAGGGLTAEEETAVQSGLEAEVARLQALGADPTDPIPEQV